MDLMNDEAMALDEQRLAMRAWKACKQDGQLLPPGVTVGGGQGYEYFHVQHGATPDAALRYYVHADGDVKLPVRLIEQLTETGLDILKARVCYDWRDEVELCAIGETGSAYAITLQRFDRRTRRLGHGRTQLDAVLDALEQQRTVETGGRDPETLYDPPPVEPPKDDSKPIRRRRRGNDVYLDPDRYERLPRIAVKPIEAAEMLGMSPRTFHELASDPRHRLGFVRIGTGKAEFRRYLVAHLHSWILAVMRVQRGDEPTSVNGAADGDARRAEAVAEVDAMIIADGTVEEDDTDE
jgi:hypothetical protein